MISKQPKKVASMKDPTYTEMAYGAGNKVTKEQLISKIIALEVIFSD